MHSSRMRTGRALTVFQYLPVPGGGTCLVRGGVCSEGVSGPRGGTCLVLGGGGVPAWSRGGTCLVRGGVSGPRGYLPGPGGVPAWSRGGGGVRYSPPVNRMNDRQV